MPLANILIREARPKDAEAMVALLQPIIDAGLTAIESTSVEEQLAFIQLFPENGIILVAVDGETGRLLGMQDVMFTEDPDVGEIGTFVDLDFRGKGVGNKLFFKMVNYLKGTEIKLIKAVIQPTNIGAQSFYSKLGFSSFTIFDQKAVYRFYLPSKYL